MSKPKKIAAIIAGSIAGLLLIVIVASLIIVQTPWFANYVREKIIATVQESTGGTVELRSFEFDPWRLTVRMRDFILHGVVEGIPDTFSVAAGTSIPATQSGIDEDNGRVFSHAA